MSTVLSTAGLGLPTQTKYCGGRESHQPLSTVFTCPISRCLHFTLKFGPAPRKFGPAPLKFGPAPLKFGPAPLRLATLVGATLLTSGLVTMAFLLAVRLLISDFFSIDIAYSSGRVFYSA